eukprot:m.270486 g.270486  ORF g.270486 m.270486 type:complete len:723 (-) comp19316_c0_seq2:165-2333(-)
MGKPGAGARRGGTKHGRGKACAKPEWFGTQDWLLRGIAFVVLGLAVAVGYGMFVAHLFENDRFFSALATHERQMSFKSEQALYFSYFKDMNRAFKNNRSFIGGLLEGLKHLAEDSTTEFPEHINLLRRFNIYPEVGLSIAFQLFQGVAGTMGWTTKQCFQVSRQEPLPPITTCHGWGDETYFYVNSVFALQGLFAFSLFTLCWLVSGQSLLGGLFGIACGLFNLRSLTRAMWAPPLREHFGFPFLAVQLCVLTVVLRNRKPGMRLKVAMGVATFLFLVPWQFSPFALLTQAASLFATFLLGYVSKVQLCAIIYPQLMAVLASVALHFGNVFLLTSPYTSFLIASILTLELLSVFPTLQSRPWTSRMLLGTALVILTALLKLGGAWALGLSDDSHIFEILKSKFVANHFDFHARLYTCSPEFDFLPASEFWELSVILLLPIACAAGLIIIFKVLLDEVESFGTQQDDWTIGSRGHSDAVYFLLQTVCYLVMAALIMRLKGFFTLGLIVLASTFCNRRAMWRIVGGKPSCEDTGETMTQQESRARSVHLALIVVIFAVMLPTGIQRVNKELAVMGEFNDQPLDDLMEFVGTTPTDASFTSTMPVTSAIRCVGERNIVNHPHYEDAGIRQRTVDLYTVYTTWPDKDVWQRINKWNADFVVLDRRWCMARRSPGCAMDEILALQFRNQTSDRDTFCQRWIDGQSKSKYFVKVHSNHVFTVLKRKTT